MLNLCKWWWWGGGCKDVADVTFQNNFLFQKYKTATTCKELLGTSGKVCTHPHALISLSIISLFPKVFSII